MADAHPAGFVEQRPRRDHIDLKGLALVPGLFDAIGQMNQRVVTGDRIEVESSAQIEERFAQLGVFYVCTSAPEHGDFCDVVAAQRPAQQGAAETAGPAGDGEAEPLAHAGARAQESSSVSRSAHQRTSSWLNSEVMQTRRIGLPNGTAG